MRVTRGATASCTSGNRFERVRYGMPPHTGNPGAEAQVIASLSQDYTGGEPQTINDFETLMVFTTSRLCDVTARVVSALALPNFLVL